MRNACRSGGERKLAAVVKRYSGGGMVPKNAKAGGKDGEWRSPASSV